ncbi:MAG: hypothetical protein WBM14_11420 [Terracidiphilus sp.]|jgi:hypothetical protein
MTDSDQKDPNDETDKVKEQEWFHAGPDAGQQNSAGGTPVSSRGGRSGSGGKSGYALLLVGVVVLAVVVVVLFTTIQPKSKSEPDDLGDGVFNAAGLRGHLVTRWQGIAQYQLQITPIDPRQSAGFALVAGKSPQPVSINIRLLDSSGFALCGKEILLPFDPANAVPAAASAAQAPAGKGRADRASKDLAARQAALQARQAQEQDRERGKDIFQNRIGADGQIDAMSVQGVLPCSADQYKRFDYWDFSTNFPTLDEQQALLHHHAGMTAQTAAETRMTARRRAAKRNQSAFYIEGDERVTGFDNASGILQAGAGKNFTIDRNSDLAAAAGWAADSSLIHYKCDQHATCALKRASAAIVIYARLNE